MAEVPKPDGERQPLATAASTFFDRNEVQLGPHRTHGKVTAALQDDSSLTLVTLDEFLHETASSPMALVRRVRHKLANSYFVPRQVVEHVTNDAAIRDRDE